MIVSVLGGAVTGANPCRGWLPTPPGTRSHWFYLGSDRNRHQGQL